MRFAVTQASVNVCTRDAPPPMRTGIRAQGYRIASGLIRVQGSLSNELTSRRKLKESRAHFCEERPEPPTWTSDFTRDFVETYGENR